MMGLGFLDSTETRAMILGYQSVVAPICLLLILWSRVQGLRDLGIAVLVAGLACSTNYFFWWNYLGRFEWAGHLIIPNLASTVLSIGLTAYTVALVASLVTRSSP